MQWILTLISVIVPGVPLTFLYLSNRLSTNTKVTVFIITFFVFWVLLATAGMVTTRYNARQSKRWNSDSIYFSYIVLGFFLILLSGIWSFSGPYYPKSSLLIFAVSSLLPISFNLIWEIVLKDYCSKFKWTEVFLLPFISAFVGLIIFEVTLNNFFTAYDFNKDIAANSPNRSYWYIVNKMGPNGGNLANSFGFLGLEPEDNYSGKRILLIGDSLPAAARSVNFPKVAQAIYEEDPCFKGQVEIANASIGSYSLEQMKNYYTGKLKDLKHDLLIIIFYIDDINRELRYRKENYLYTPSWPEWMQDIYYSSLSCRLLLNLSGFTDNTFVVYRTRSYEDCFPAALNILDEIRISAKKRNIKVALFNIPRFSWPAVLPELSGYTYLEINRKLEEWCKTKSVPYHDILPVLVGKDIRKLRISDADYHFNDPGHQVIGVELKNFIDTLIPFK